MRLIPKIVFNGRNFRQLSASSGSLLINQPPIGSGFLGVTRASSSSSTISRRRCYSTIGMTAKDMPSHNFGDVELSEEAREALSEERFADEEVDVLIVGAGPAGLSAAIRAKQAAAERNEEIRVVVVEKAAEVGAHTLSGAVLEPTALDELLPDWKERGAPLHTQAGDDHMYWFASPSLKIPLPVPPHMHNRGNYIVSMAAVVKWLGEQAEELGVEIFPGFAGSQVLYGDDGQVCGVATNDVGVGKKGEKRDNFERGMELRARVTLFGEGCRGSLSEEVIRNFQLREAVGASPQTYGIGLKEVWRVKPEKHHPGKVVHSIGFPVDYKTWGGAFLYHWGDDCQVSLGYVIGLDYWNPHLNTYRTFQQWKTHSYVADLLEGGECLSYGARALNEGGFQSIPKLVFPGGALIGCSAGFLNVPKVKGNHNAMKSGMLAAEAAVNAVIATRQEESSAAATQLVIDEYETNLKNSWVWKDMQEVRNVRPMWQTALGMYGGALWSGLDLFLLRGRIPWTAKVAHADHETLMPADKAPKIEYPKPDGKLTFDLLTNLARTGTNHEENQPAHLRVQDPSIPVAHNLAVYDGPESRYCPAGVYEYVDDEATGAKRLQINAQNCIHCKTCSIKDPKQNIRWTTPEGAGGPAYDTSLM